MATATTVKVTVEGGPSVDVPWAEGMTAQDALEAAYDALKADGFTFALQYYGQQLGYLVLMINETYDTFISKAEPYFYWEFLLNGAPATSGIDSVRLHAADEVGFSYVLYVVATHGTTILNVKHQSRLR
jgi:hypothetical protein